jgi:hypothetical protein
MAAKNIAGQRFGRLVAQSMIGTSRDRKAIWSTLCDCGASCVVRGKDLRSGNTKSCGCLRVDVTRESGRARLTHGHSRRSSRLTPEYISWSSAKTRCFNPNKDDYAHYGGRGITMCDRWRDSFEAFLADMGPRPKGKTLDRINVNGHYEPRNCRWATPKEQQENRRPVRRHAAVDMARLRALRSSGASVNAIAKQLGLDWQTVKRRLVGEFECQL